MFKIFKKNQNFKKKSRFKKIKIFNNKKEPTHRSSVESQRVLKNITIGVPTVRPGKIFRIFVKSKNIYEIFSANRVIRGKISEISLKNITIGVSRTWQDFQNFFLKYIFEIFSVEEYHDRTSIRNADRVIPGKIFEISLKYFFKYNWSGNIQTTI